MIDLQLTQRDLGNYVGLSRENVSRRLGKLKEAGAVRIEGASIYVADQEALSDIVERDE